MRVFRVRGIMPVLMRLDLQEFDVEDEGGVGRNVARLLLAVGIFCGDGYLHLVACTHTGQGHLEAHDEVAHDKAGGHLGRSSRALARTARGVEHFTVDEASGVVAIDDVGGARISAVGSSRHDGAALDPAIHGTARQHRHTVFLSAEFEIVAIGVAIEVAVLFHDVAAFCGREVTKKSAKMRIAAKLFSIKLVVVAVFV